MKYLVGLFAMTVVVSVQGQTPSIGIAGTWQQVENKTCFQSQLPESQTEKELLPDMGSSSNTSVAKLIRFDVKGKVEEGIFSTGKKKGSDRNAFQYKVEGEDLILLDKKSGIMTQHFIIDTLTESTLVIHDAAKDC